MSQGRKCPWDAEGTERQGIWADVPSADAVIDRPGQSISLHSRLFPAPGN